MKVSVIICTRNQADYLKTAISSVLSNTYQNFELLLIDQSTNELTKEAVQLYAEQDSRVRYFHMSIRGKCLGLNYGIKISQGEIVAITDSDCLVAQDWLEKIIFVFNRYPDIDIVYGSLIPDIDSKKKWFVPGVILRDRIFSGPRSKIFENGMGANMAIRRRLFEKIGYFDEFLGPGSFFCGGDEWDFSYRALKNGSKVAHSSSIKVKHFGRRDSSQWGELLKGYRIADAAVFFKHIRCFDLDAAYVLIGSYIIYIHRVVKIKTADLDNRGLIQRIVYKIYLFFLLSFCFLKGIVLSMKFPVDRRRQIFYEEPSIFKYK